MGKVHIRVCVYVCFYIKEKQVARKREGLCAHVNTREIAGKKHFCIKY